MELPGLQISMTIMLYYQRRYWKCHLVACGSSQMLTGWSSIQVSPLQVSLTQCCLLSSETCSNEAQRPSSKSISVSNRPAQQPSIAQIIPLEKVISPGQVKTASYVLVSEKGPSSFLFIKGDWLGQKVGKNLMSLHQQEDAIQSTGNETLGFPLALNTILVLIFQSTQERITQPDPTGLICSLYKWQRCFFPLPPCITRVEASLL